MGSVSGMATGKGSKEQKSEPYLGHFPPNPPQVAVQVPKPAFFRHLLSAEHTKEEPLAYEKYNKEN